VFILWSPVQLERPFLLLMSLLIFLSIIHALSICFRSTLSETWILMMKSSRHSSMPSLLFPRSGVPALVGNGQRSHITFLSSVMWCCPFCYLSYQNTWCLILDYESKEILQNIALTTWIDMLACMKRCVLLVIAVVVGSHCLPVCPCPCVMDDKLDRDTHLHHHSCFIAHHCPVQRVPWSVVLGLHKKTYGTVSCRVLVKSPDVCHSPSKFQC